MLQLIATFALVLPLQEPAPIRAPIVEVTVFPGSALVRRHAEIAGGTGRFVLAGLPRSMDPESVRVRCSGAEVIGTETRERFEKSVPDARVEELRLRSRDVTRELATLNDELGVLEQVAAHLARLADAPLGAGDKQATTNSREAWAKNLEYISQGMLANRAALRDTRARVEACEVRAADIETELGAADGGQGVHLRDVVVEVDGGAGAAVLDIEYVVAHAGWSPLYDLRTAPDARSVELGYRARVWQRSGEDWTDVEMSLSTAQPRLGAQGPDPDPIWLSVLEVERKRGAKSKSGGIFNPDPAASEKYKDSDGGDPEVSGSPAPRPFASVDSQGLSLRFRLAKREDVQSRPEPSTVLVGQQRLDVTPEYFLAAELDPNVWLRGKCVNTSPLVLPGSAAVYFGADYLGQARLEAVQPGAEFVLHLGFDPAFTVERTELENLIEGPGVFGSKATHRQVFRVRIANSGAAVARADGSALVFVREALPKTTDERIDVELVKPSAKPSDDARWKREREEQGVITWQLAVPRSGETVLEYAREVSYPSKATVVER